MCCCRVYHPPNRSINSNSNNNNNTVRAPAANHTQVKRQTTQDSQTKNLIFKSTTVDKTNNINANATNNIDVVVNHNGSSLAQDDDNVTVVIETKKLVDSITNVNTMMTATKDKNNYISNNNNERFSEIGSAGDAMNNNNHHYHYQHQHQNHHHRQSLVSDISKSEQEKEPFIANERANSNHVVSEKLIDFAGAANNNPINKLNNPKLCLIESSKDKVWI